MYLNTMKQAMTHYILQFSFSFFHSLEPTEMNYLITIVYNNEYIIILYHIFLQKLLCNSFEHVICIRHWL